ncbi:hypothetical protein QTP70_030229 [Hemibagrus guttatus]|uniref:Apolipoprotein C-I n=1 Tax=Hemibagrus guttatus TaxID=175788 RepID=A0AAE0RF64_9TELE|nr:hypothetical protein QTP70_030229 [Hemibagrus guttatus]
MKLYLAVATLMLVLIAHSEAAEEPTIEEQVANFHAKIQAFGTDLSDKATKALKELTDSELFTKTSNWFTDKFEKVKNKFDETFTQ